MAWLALNRRQWLLLIWLLPLLGVGWTVAQAPDWREPHHITLTLEPGESVTLGSEALAAPQADSEHVQVRREANGDWRLINLSPNKQVLWQPTGERQYRTVREWPLTAGATFAVGASSLQATIIEPGRLILTSAGRRWEYDGFRLSRVGEPLPECYDNWRTAFRERLSAWSGLRRWLQRPLRLGGGVYCADRLGVADAPVDVALIVPAASGFVLRSGTALGQANSPPVIVAAQTPKAEALALRPVPLTAGDGLIIGRTAYRVTRTMPVLELTVLTRAQRWLAGSEQPAFLPGVAVQWQAMAWLWPPSITDWAWPMGLGLAGLGVGLVVLRRDWWTAVALGLAGVSLGLYLNRSVLPMSWSGLLAWSAMGVWLLTVRSRWSQRLLAALTLLLGIGLIAGWQLAVGAGESGWSRYSGGNAALAGMFGWLAWTGWRERWLFSAWLNIERQRWGLRFLGGAALGLLILQILFGDETGWAGFQPFELVQWALTMAAAYALAPLARQWTSTWRRWLRLRTLIPIGLLAVASSFALIFLRDFSPLALLAVWGLVLVWAWVRVQPRPIFRRLGQLTVLALVVAMIGSLMWLQERPEDFPLDFQADRIRVWAAPDQHPHAGYQLRRALEAIRAGGWTGTVWAESVNGWIMHIPAVEDDFMPTFFLNRYGGLAALALAGVQAAFIGILLAIADRAARRLLPSNAPGGLAYFALWGGAALLGAHFLASWGANLGFLPVMGQPMSLLSTGGSHLTLLVLPVVALAVAVEDQVTQGIKNALPEITARR
ncbi:MAG: hypothetical protein QG599_3838 [Pseudomonadota bacterium]|nr:hypothetical protein [Pseudomonadota bacterium]